MKKIVIMLVSVSMFCCTSVFAQIKECEELKAEIEAKLQKKGVKGYTLEIIPADQVRDQKIIGSCAGGTKKISYSREKSK